MRRSTTAVVVEVVAIVFGMMGNAVGEDELRVGQPHSSVQHLTVDNFDTALNDPANGVWFLKFYAPWCGHCQRMAPVLDKVAPLLEGKMAMGKVDCTKQRPLCDRFSVKGYPTLKFHRDGEFYDYTGGRDEAALQTLGERLAAPPIVELHSQARDQLVAQSPQGVAFVAFFDGKKAKEEEEEKNALAVFRQVARKMQAFAHFGLLSSDTSEAERAKFGFTDAGFRVAKLETDVSVPPLLYQGDVSNQEDLLKFVQENNTPLVTRLGPHNFRTVGNMGRPLVIAALNEDDEKDSSQALSTALTEYAKGTTTTTTIPKYTFGVMNGKPWSKFLSQFSIDKLPQLFVLDVPAKLYWQDEALGLEGEIQVAAFLQAVESGTLAPRHQHQQSGWMQRVLDPFVEWLPGSAIAVVFLLVLLFVVCLPVEPYNEAHYQEVVAAAAAEAESKKDK